MNEKEWVDQLVHDLTPYLLEIKHSIKIEIGRKIPYGYEILSYKDGIKENNLDVYETDVLISEVFGDESWKPRVILEAKFKSITTHDAITYSQKAFTHKTVHPYLRYGIILGDRQHYPLPGRLFRHGAYFDFMASFTGERATKEELERFTSILEHEINASKQLESIIYESRKRNREKFTLLHKRLHLE